MYLQMESLDLVHALPQVNLVGIECFKAGHETRAEIVWFVRVMLLGHTWADICRIELRVQTSPLPIQISQVFFG